MFGQHCYNDHHNYKPRLGQRSLLARFQGAAIALVLLAAASAGLFAATANAMPLKKGSDIECKPGQPIDVSRHVFWQVNVDPETNCLRGLGDGPLAEVGYSCHCPSGTVVCDIDPKCAPKSNRAFARPSPPAAEKAVARPAGSKQAATGGSPAVKAHGKPRASHLTANTRPVASIEFKPARPEAIAGLDQELSSKREMFIARLAKKATTTTTSTTTTTTTTTTPQPIEEETNSENNLQQELLEQEFESTTSTHITFEPTTSESTPASATEQPYEFENEFIEATHSNPNAANSVEQNFEFACLILVGLLFTLLVAFLLASAVLCVALSCFRRRNLKHLSNISSASSTSGGSTSSSSCNLPTELSVGLMRPILSAKHLPLSSHRFLTKI